MSAPTALGLAPAAPTGLAPAAPMGLASAAPMGLAPATPMGLAPAAPLGLAPAGSTVAAMGGAGAAPQLDAGLKDIVDGIIADAQFWDYVRANLGDDVIKYAQGTLVARVVEAKIRTTRGAAQKLFMKEETAQGKTAEGVKKPKAPRDPNRPKKPTTGYMRWVNQIGRASCRERV